MASSSSRTVPTQPDFKIVFESEDQLLELCKILDQKGWKELGLQIGYTSLELEILESRATKGPSYELFKDWENEKDAKALRLQDMLRDISQPAYETFQVILKRFFDGPDPHGPWSQ